MSLVAVIEPLNTSSIAEDTVMFNETESGHIIQRGEHAIRLVLTYTLSRSLHVFHLTTPRLSVHCKLDI